MDEAIISVWGFFSRWDFLSVWTAVLAGAVLVYGAGLFRIVKRSSLSSIRWERVGLGAFGFIALSFALIGPFDVFSGQIFWAHMTQHMILVIVAAPAMLAAGPLSAFLWAAPKTVRIGAGSLLERRSLLRRFLELASRPRVALPLLVIVMWGWHYPPAYEAALNNAYVHFAEHLSMFVAASFFWWPLIGPPPVRSKISYPQRVLYLALAVTPNAALAALITFSDDVLYRFYLDAPKHFGLSAEENQVIGGLIMWLPGSFTYVAALTAVFFTWAQKEMQQG